MSRKRIFLIIFAALTVLLVLVGFISIRSRIINTENKLGPGSSDLSAVQRIRLALKCSEILDQFDSPVSSFSGRFLLDIESGEGVTSVINKISEGLECSPDPLRLYWIYTGADRLIRPGRYALSGSLSVPQITDLVTAAGKSLVRFAFFSGKIQ